MTMLNDFLPTSATWGVLLTLAAFALGTFINRKTGKAIFNPLLLGTVFVIVFLSVCSIPYEDYKASASPVSYLLLPATVSLAVPLYEKWDLLRKNVLAIVMGILAGTLASLGSVLVLALLLKLDHSQYITLLPKSVTTAIAVSISESNGGLPGLTAAAVCVTGIEGAMLAPFFAKIFHVTDPVAEGVAIGACSHAVGTSKALEIGPLQGAMSSIALCICGIITSLIAGFFAV